MSMPSSRPTKTVTESATEIVENKRKRDRVICRLADQVLRCERLPSSSERHLPRALHAELLEAFDDPLRLVERRDDQEIEGDLTVALDIAHRLAEEGAAAGAIEDRDQFEAQLGDGQIRELGSFAGSVDRDALPV